MSKDTSGPAFQPGYCPPFAVFPAGSQQPDTNMSLRDWFAGHEEGPDGNCDEEFVADCLGWPRPEIPMDDLRARFVWWSKANAEWKYQRADAMLIARGKS